MRKLFYLVVSIVIFGLIISGCFFHVVPPLGKDESIDIVKDAVFFEIDLIAGQHTVAGFITVSNDDKNLYVTYKTSDNWLINQTHLYVDQIAPTESAPGRFPYKHENLKGATTDYYEISLEDLGVDPCDIVYIAAHAELIKGEIEETGWAEGVEIRPDKNWAMYFEYRLSCMEEIATQILETQDLGRQYFEQLESQGDPNALQKTIDYLKTQPNVYNAEVGGDGVSIWVEYKSGIKGIILTESFGSLGGLPISTSYRSNFPTTSAKTTSANQKAIILLPFDSVEGCKDESVDAIFTYLLQSGYSWDNIEIYRGEEVTVILMTTLSDYNFIYMTTHGMVGPFVHDISITTGEIAVGNIFTEIWTQLRNLEIQVVSIPDVSGHYWALNHKFLEHYTYQGYPGSFVYINACNSLKNDSLVDVFLNNGASVCLGWDNITFGFLFAGLHHPQFFQELSKPNNTLQQAYDDTLAKYYPANVYKNTNHDKWRRIILFDGKDYGDPDDITFDSTLNLVVEGNYQFILNPSIISSIEVLPETMTLIEGDSQSIDSIIAYYENGSTANISLDDCTYDSSDPGVATVDSGVIAAVTEGTATITVSYTESGITKTDTVVVTVQEETIINGVRYQIQWSTAESNGWVNPLGEGEELITNTEYDYNSDIYLQKRGRRHVGVDIVTQDETQGETNVYAIADGTVDYVVTQDSWYDDDGILRNHSVIFIKHTNSENENLFAIYGHVLAKDSLGSTVKAGEKIGVVKQSGTPCHLHFGINLSSERTDFIFINSDDDEWGWGRIPDFAIPSKYGWVDPIDYLNTHSIENIILNSITVSPSTMSLVEGDSQTIFSIIAHYSDDSTADIALDDCTYDSNNTGVATADTGVIAAVAPGTATITVRYLEGDITKSDTVEVTVEGGYVVEFEDPNLERVVREAIDKHDGSIYLSDVIGITRLDAEGRGIISLEGIQHLKNLEDLWLVENQVSDISPLANLTHLISLSFGYGGSNQVSDISPLANLTNLKWLNFETNQVSDISPLANLTHLISLSFAANQVSDISPLANLTNLSVLGLGFNQVSDISPLANLTDLQWLSFASNQVSDISPLANLTNLSHLYFHENQVSDISVLSNMTNLRNLEFHENQVSDISPLTNLTNLLNLSFDYNQVLDISPLTNLTRLIYLSFDYNQVSDISPLTNLTNLLTLSFASNQVSDISPLANLINLYWLWFDDNQVSDISSLVLNEGFGSGDTIWMSNNYLDLTEGSQNMKDIETLIGRSVNVYYEPQSNP